MVNGLLDWMKNRGARAVARPSARADVDPEPSAHVGEYQLLYKYLHDRYANRVVLTFGEIEDILGFALPEPARRQPEWWGAADPIARRSAQSDSWTFASRTASVNLVAQHVVFDRKAPANLHSGKR